jgi:ABC-type branched-subunit amino acid transport system substrate-binding protein
MIDYFIKKGGVEGYQIEAVYADAQSKPDIAINEAVRLVEQEKVDMLLGFYSSAQCVPAAARVEQLKKFMWITTCISSAVLENRHLKYVFRSQPSGRQFGLMSTDFLAQNAKAKLGKEPKDLRVAIIHEDGAYGADVSKGNEEGAKKAGFNIVLKEGYSATAARSFRPRHQAEARAARCDLPHRLQPGHHAVLAPGARTGPEVPGARRPWRGLRRVREAEGRPRGRRQLRLQHRSDLDLGANEKA